MPQVAMRYELHEVVEQHGNDYVRVDAGQGFDDLMDEHLLWRNGAMWYTNGKLVQPPTTTHGKQTAELQFLTVKLEQEKHDFDRYKTYVTEQSNNSIQFPDTCPPPPPNAKAALEAGLERIRQYEDRIAELQANLNKGKGTDAKVEQHKANVEAQTELQQNLLTLNY